MYSVAMAEEEETVDGSEQVSAQGYALRGDRPIESAEADRLGRARFAKAVARQVLGTPSLESFVVAIMGPWGAGKTSLLNMLAEEMKLRSETVILRFNPWIFSDTEQLVSHFFRELGAQMSELNDDRLSKVGSALKTYGGLFGSVVQFVPTVGGALKAVADVASQAGETFANGPSIEHQRDHIRKTLAKAEQRIVVIVDDIDRLRRDDIRELVKLVRLTGDFPNVVYVLAFDRNRVEAALGDDSETGRAYLEKIVQVGYDIPHALESDVSQLLLNELNAALSPLDEEKFDQRHWENVYYDVIRHLVRSPRDVRRYVNAIPATLEVLGDEVDVVDVLALEAIRVFLPDVFARLYDAIDALALDAALPQGHVDKERGRRVLEALTNAGGNRRAVVERLLQRLFPGTAGILGNTLYGASYMRLWRRTRRVAVADVLRYYLQRRLPDDKATTSEVTRAMAALRDRQALTNLLDAFPAAKLEDLFLRLDVVEDEFEVLESLNAAAALLSQLDRLRRGKTHMFDLGAEFPLRSLVLRLLRGRTDEDPPPHAPLLRAVAIDEVIPTLRTLSAQHELIEVIEDHTLAGVENIALWKEELLDRVARQAPALLAKERRLVQLLARLADRSSTDAELVDALLGMPAVLVALLTTSVGTVRSQPMSDVGSSSRTTLPWDALCTRFGGSRFEQRVREARPQLAGAELRTSEHDALSLAEKYAAGWRPSQD